MYQAVTAPNALYDATLSQAVSLQAYAALFGARSTMIEAYANDGEIYGLDQVQVPTTGSFYLVLGNSSGYEQLTVGEEISNLNNQPSGFQQVIYFAEELSSAGYGDSFDLLESYLFNALQASGGTSVSFSKQSF